MADKSELNVNEMNEDELFEHFDNISQQINHMEIEIKIKKDQLKTITNAHDKIQLEKQKLEFDLERETRIQTEMEQKYNLMLKSLKDFEQKYSSTLDEFNVQSVQFSEKEAENKYLRDALLKCQSEKTEMIRKLEDFTSKTACIEMHKNQIKQQISEVLMTTKILQEQIVLNQDDITKISKKFEEISNCRESLKTNEFYESKLKECIKLKEHFEEGSIFYKAKCQKFEALMDPKGFLDNESNLFFDQWIQLINLHKCQIISSRKIINNLICQLNQEKLANVKLNEQLNIKQSVKMDLDEGWKIQDTNKKENELKIEKKNNLDN